MGTIREGFAVMKHVIFLTLGLSLSLGALQAQAQSSASLPTSEGVSEMHLDNEKDDSFTDIKARIVPQVGMSSMGYTGKLSGSEGQGFSGGVTTELGTTKARLLETGLLFMQNRSTVKTNTADQSVSTSEIAIPMMGKIRFIDRRSQSWYFKIGALTTFETSTNASNTSSMDVLASLGAGVRLPVNRKMDFLIEATYNRGVLSAFFQDNSAQQGLLAFTGLSIAL